VIFHVDLLRLVYEKILLKTNLNLRVDDIGWSMSDRINTDLALGALTMVCWRRRDHAGVVVYADQGLSY
jgi:hypothetical protein